MKLRLGLMLGILPALLQAQFASAQVASKIPTEYEIVVAEHARGDASVLVAALKAPDAKRQRIALRALGRLERVSLMDTIAPMLQSTNPDVRAEAVGALAQIGAPYAFGSLLGKEGSATVRAAIYDAIGRVKPVPNESETVLVNGLRDGSGEGRTGAIRGLESLYRLNRTMKPSAQVIEALRGAFRSNTDEVPRELALLTLNAAADRDSATLAIGLRDPSAQVRRLAVAGSRQWVDDVSPMVRVQALRSAGNCERALAATKDTSDMVSLLAITMFGDRKCDAAPVEAIVESGKNWRARSRALVALAKVAPDAAKKYVPRFAADANWNVRVYAATAAKLVKDEVTRDKLAHDAAPNVVIEAMSTPADAIRALSSNHAGLLFAAANKLKGTPELKGAMPTIVATLNRLNGMDRETVKDPRVALMERVREAGDTSAVRPYRGKPYKIPMTEGQFVAYRDVLVRVTMKGLGTFTIEFLWDDAPVTAAVFLANLNKKQFDGLTFHRIEPNFVVQGASPGADEYDGLTSYFMRDEVGASNLRGTLGTSTRGHDTGDGQIYVNTIDNFRLDHQYTVFARVTSGMNVVDRVQEGDVIESVIVSWIAGDNGKKP